MGSDTRPRGYSPLCQPSYCGRGPERVRIAQGADELVRCARRLLVVELLADVVEVEEVVDEVAAHPQLLVVHKWVAHGREEAALEPVKGRTPLLAQLASREEPLLGFL